MNIKKDILWRVYLTFFLVVLFGVAIVIQLIRVQFVQGNFWRQRAQNLTTAFMNIDAIREISTPPMAAC